MRFARRTVVASLLLILGSLPLVRSVAAEKDPGAFVVKPYLQLGDAPRSESLMLLWHAEDRDADWSVEYRGEGQSVWKPAAAPSPRVVRLPSIAPHRVYRARLSGLEPGKAFSYRVRRQGEVVFSAEGRARPGADRPHRFVLFGDCGAGTAAQRAIAFQAHRARPELLLIAGDIVYSRGRVSEYREKFWPVYNADEASPAVGAPLLRSIVTVAAPGNHDIATRDLAKYPDALAYFLYWDQPLNGPLARAGAPSTPTLEGPQANRDAFLAAAGSAYPRMANFSFDYGNVHWTVLDANAYVDWTDPALLAWVARDLASARSAGWRFVTFHHPGFNSSKAHFDDQRMRMVSEVLEAGGVDVVFNGHVHNYQRSYPLRFVPEPVRDGKADSSNKGRIAGRWKLDRRFDGQTHTRPDGIIYIVSGAGGANLYNPEQHDDPASWQEFTHKFHSKSHSLTIADVAGSSVTIRQVSVDGEELDRFTLTH